MTWILWATFVFSNGPTLAYPLEVYDNGKNCHEAALFTQHEYQNRSKELFPTDQNVKIILQCQSRAKV